MMPANTQAENSPRVVFLANDAVYDQGLAFLESFRKHNSDIKLSMIPFAEDVDKLLKLSSNYNFDLLDVDLKKWDDLGKEFFPNVPKKYQNRLRKLSIFDAKGPATIYLDLDMVVLSDLKFLAAPIIDGSADFICTATGNDPYVYNTKYKEIPELRNAKRFSDGFFVFNPNRINADLAYSAVVDNKELYFSVRAADVYCQPVTNFIVDIMQLKAREVFSLFPEISPQVWYASPHISLEGSEVRAHDGRKVLFVHWAGPVDMEGDYPLKELFEHYQAAAVARNAAPV